MEEEKIIEDLYEGTLDPVAWNRTMLAIADAVRASGAMVFAFNPGNGAILRDEHHRVDPKVVNDYARYWIFEDFRRHYCWGMPTGQPATEVSLAIPLKGTRLYHELLVPVDLPHFLPVWLHKSKEKMVALSLQGSNKRGPFDVTDLEFIRRIFPHLARAFEIRDRLEAADLRASNFAKLLNTTTFGVLVLNAQKKILEANSVASDLLDGGSGLQRGKDGVLVTNHPGGDRMFRCRDANASQASADALTHIPREGKLPLSVMVLPIRASRTSWMSGEPAWVLLLFDPERKLAVNQQLIMRDLSLSEREAKVAALLAAGLQPDQIARRMHVTVHTVRSQIKSAFQKTGCHTQAQLVKRLLLGPGFSMQT